MEDASSARQITSFTLYSQDVSLAGSPPASLTREPDSFVICPVCQKTFRSLTNTHLKTHQLTIQKVLDRWPGLQLESAATKAERTAKVAAAQRKRLEEDPKFVEKKRTQGKRLAQIRASLTAEENAEIQARSTATYLAKTTAEERSAKSAVANKIARDKYPDLSSRGGKAGGKYWQTEEGRRRASEKFLAIWESADYRVKMSLANLKSVLDGRTPLIVKNRPTSLEKKLLVVLKDLSSPLIYTGDGSLRIVIPNGNRWWRNPDFVLPGSNTIVLLDGPASNRKERAKEEEDYMKVRINVVRISYLELRKLAPAQEKILGLPLPSSEAFFLTVPFTTLQLGPIVIITPEGS